MSEKMEIDIIVNGKNAVNSLKDVERGTKKVEQQTKKTDSQIEKSSKSIKANWVAIGAAVAGATATIAKSTSAYQNQLKAEIALTSALKANRVAGQDTLEMWRDFASALQDTTLFGDEQTLQQVAMLKAMGLTDDQMKKVIKTAMDLSSATGETLESSVINLAKTYSGLGGELSEKIPQLRELTAEQLRQGEAVEIVSRLYEGQAKAIADTDYGKVTQSYMALGDAMEGVGNVIYDLADDIGFDDFIKGLATGINGAVKIFYQAKEAVYEFDIALAEFFGADERAEMLKKDLQETQEKLASLNNTPIKLDPLKIEGKEEARGVLDAISDAWINYSNTAKTVGGEVTTRQKAELDELQKAAEVALGATEDYFVQLAMTGKASFKDLAQSVIADIMRIYVRSLLLKAIGVFTGVPVVHTGGEVKHTGGYIGSNLPTYHSGMRSDERIAKLQVGEAVINRAGARQNAQAIDAMNAGYKVGGGGDNITTAEINFNVQAIDASSFNSYLVNNKSTIEGIINNSLRTNGSVRKTIKQTV